MFSSLDVLEQTLLDRSHLRLRVACPSQEFSAEEMSYGVGRWHSCVRGLWEVLAVPAEPDLALVMLQAPAVPTSVIDYLLGLRRLDASAASDARSRLAMVQLDDESPLHLSEKFLTRWVVMDRLKWTVNVARRMGHTVEGLSSFASSEKVAQMAELLGIPLLETPPSALHWNGKAGSRQLFRRAGLPHLPGTYRTAHDVDQLTDDLAALTLRHGAGTWLVKTDQGFGSGHGNASVEIATSDRDSVLASVKAKLRPVNPVVPIQKLWDNFVSAGAIVEQLAVSPLGEPLRFPSVALHLSGSAGSGVVPTIIGTHEQIIAADQSFVGATSPAEHYYRNELVRLALLAAKELERVGVRGHASVDFVAVKNRHRLKGWRLFALEVNLRQTGTTCANRTAMLLTGARIRKGRFQTSSGQKLCYATTDNLIRESYRAISSEMLITALRARTDLTFSSSAARGIVPHLWTTMIPFGKVGATAFAQSVADSVHLQQQFEYLLDELGRQHGC